MNDLGGELLCATPTRSWMPMGGGKEFLAAVEERKLREPPRFTFGRKRRFDPQPPINPGRQQPRRTPCTEALALLYLIYSLWPMTEVTVEWGIIGLNWGITSPSLFFTFRTIRLWNQNILQYLRSQSTANPYNVKQNVLSEESAPPKTGK